MPPDPALYRVPFLDLSLPYKELKSELDLAYHRVMGSGRYILGEEVEAFEAEFATYCGTKSCVSVANGLEALWLILKGYEIGPEDEVLVPANTFIATWLAVSHAGATVVPVEPLLSTFNIDPASLQSALTPRTRAIIAVHLYGQPAAMDEIRQFAHSHNLRVIEDAAQAQGARYRGARVGGLSDAAAFSFYPTKNLGAFGDGGAVVTNDENLERRIRMLRNYGSTSRHCHDVPGFNSRLDSLQAAFLRVRLRHLDEWNSRRQTLANLYLRKLDNVHACLLPVVPAWTEPVWHQFVVRHPNRNQLRDSLAAKGIETDIHYPVPPHLSKAYFGSVSGDLPRTEELSRTILSLPINSHLHSEHVLNISAAIIESTGEMGHGG